MSASNAAEGTMEALTRPLPTLTPENAAFWESGKDGRLRIQHCKSCGAYQHPPGPICRRCVDNRLEWKVVSGGGTVRAVTVNHYPWNSLMELPYVVAIVELDEQEGLSFMSNVISSDEESVSIGMRVQVTFEPVGDVFIPLFVPAGTR
ncbi:Zn-ribbon domain-containing OB-fold protein [Rhodococcus sp. 5G237]